MKTITTQCCIAGGGPAGIMLGYLLSRAGIPVVVLEKWPDFFRDFRGDTIHPSTMEILHELGILEDFLKLPHNETHQMVGHVGGKEVTIADFDLLLVRSPFIAFIPQWDFLNFLAKKSRAFKDFTLMMETEVVDIIQEKGRVVGVKVKNKEEEIEIRAEVTIGADGRHSIVREKAKLKGEDLGAPIDVLWFRIPRDDDGTMQSFGYIDSGKFLVMLDRDDYWQCAFIIEKGGLEKIKKSGIEAFRKNIASLAPFITSNLEELKDWDQIKLLSVTVDHLMSWYKEGLLCIGDSAHAMSPVGGVGINLAIQDAVATANVLIPAFRKGTPSTNDFAKIQKRRELPTRRMQRLQVFLHTNVILPILRRTTALVPPWPLRMIMKIHILRYIPARIIGIGFRPEHIKVKF